MPEDANIHYIPVGASSAPFENIVQQLEGALKSSSPSTIHRLIVPTILSPMIYPTSSSQPANVIRFFHALRRLLRQYSDRLVAMITLPLELHPRSLGLIRWAEILSDGLLELTPFPHLMDASNSLAESGGARSNDEQPQGLVRVHKLPVSTERGEGGAGAENSIGDDLAFTLSRRKFAIRPFSLPPMEGDESAQREAGSITGRDVEF